MISARRLASLLHPRSVALIGATDNSGWSCAVYRNLVELGFQGRIHLVNRRGGRAHGRETVTSCTEIGEEVDVAFMMMPQPGILAALTDAAAAGIRNVMVLASGYADAGEAGRKAQEALVAHAESLGMLLLGPNHMGFANIIHQIPVTAMPGLPRQPGSVAVVSQSGLTASAMLEFAAMTGIGLSHVVTVGNEAMVTAGHVLGYLADDEHTAAVALFLETMRDPEVFTAAARRAAGAGKAVVVVKAGSSEMSACTVAAHSGAEAGDEQAADALFGELGVIRAGTIEELMLTAGAAAHLGRLARPGIAVVSASGGACVLVADHAAEAGAELPRLAPATRAALARILPDFGTAQNPLDVTGAVMSDPSIFTRSIEVVAADPAVGVVAVIGSFPWRPDEGPWTGQALAEAIGAGARAAPVPVVCLSHAVQPVTARTRQVLADAGIPYLIPGLRYGMFVLRNVAWWSRHGTARAG